jgi:hypothetical protein
MIEKSKVQILLYLAPKERRMFNTLRYAKMLEEAGFSRDQAETSIKILVEIMEDRLATKQDIRELKLELTLRMGTMLTASVAILAAIIKLV